MASVSLSARAHLDLESIALHHAVVLAQSDAAYEITGKLLDALEQPGDFPRMGKVFEHGDLQRPYRRLLAHGYWIYYELDGESVTVLRIFHESHDIDDFALL